MSRRTPHIVVVGSSNTDMIVQTERIPRPGETLLGGRFTMAAGGKGANQAVAAARAGGRVWFVGAVGDDVFGTQAVSGLQADGINVDGVRRIRGEPSGVALIVVARDGQNSIAVAPGANQRISAQDVAAAHAVIANADVLLVQLEIPLAAVIEAVRIASAVGVRLILNPAPAQDLPDDLLRQVTILTPNETEAEILTGIRVSTESEAAGAADQLRHRGVKTVIITLGPRGAFVSSDEGETLVAGFPVQAVDTTAAGDVFNGALAVALGEDRPLLEAVRFANAAAALSVTRLGAQPSAPARAEIEAFGEGG